MARYKVMGAGAKPCPFCGGKTHVNYNSNFDITFFECHDCHACVSFMDDDGMAEDVIKYNRRTDRGQDENIY